MKPMIEDKLRRAVRSLDPSDDTLWEADGAPKAAAIYNRVNPFAEGVQMEDAVTVIAALGYGRDRAREERARGFPFR